MGEMETKSTDDDEKAIMNELMNKMLIEMTNER